MKTRIVHRKDITGTDKYKVQVWRECRFLWWDWSRWANLNSDYYGDSEHVTLEAARKEEAYLHTAWEEWKEVPSKAE